MLPPINNVSYIPQELYPEGKDFVAKLAAEYDAAIQKKIEYIAEKDIRNFCTMTKLDYDKWGIYLVVGDKLHCNNVTYKDEAGKESLIPILHLSWKFNQGIVIADSEDIPFEDISSEKLQFSYREYICNLTRIEKEKEEKRQAILDQHKRSSFRR